MYVEWVSFYMSALMLQFENWVWGSKKQNKCETEFFYLFPIIPAYILYLTLYPYLTIFLLPLSIAAYKWLGRRQYVTKYSIQTGLDKLGFRSSEYKLCRKKQQIKRVYLYHERRVYLYHITLQYERRGEYTYII